MRISSSARRSGFTLVEVLVAAGLCMLIMAVLTAAFAGGIDTFSLLKSTGELNDRLALAKGIMTSDLADTHLEDDTGLPLKVSNVRYDLIGTQDATLGRYAKPPARGFLRIIQENVSVNEGTDPDGIPSSMAANHILHMTVRRVPDQPSNLFLARVPNTAWTSTSIAGFPASGTDEYPPDNSTGTPVPRSFGYRLQRECIGALSGFPAGTADRTFASNWAEVAYMLRDTGTFTTGPAPKPLFSLHRRIRLLTKNDFIRHELSWGAALQPNYPGLSVSPVTKQLNGPGDITNPRNRMGDIQGIRAALASGLNIDAIAPVADAAGNLTGEDVLLTNVISFEIKAAWDPGLWVVNEGTPPPPLQSIVVTSPRGFPQGEDPFDDLPLIPSVQPGFTQTQGMNNIAFPAGSGNNLFSRNSATPPPPGTHPELRVFDTWTSQPIFPPPVGGAWNQPYVSPGPNTMPNPNCVPLPIRLKAVQIKIRIYDPKNHLTRQITFIQDL